jgi:hypothetical protein
VGCNIFLTRENVGQFDALVADLLAHGVTQLWVGPASFLPTARSRRYEALRPTLADLLPLAERVLTLPGPHFGQEIWSDLAAYTEAAYVRRALEGAWGEWGEWGERPTRLESVREEYTLVCRPNLDLYWDLAGRYRRRYGNLRRDDAQEVLRAALADSGGAGHAAPAEGGAHDDALWFTLDPIPDVHELAARFGDPEGDRVHVGEQSPRYWWLDLAEHEQRRSRAGQPPTA